MSTLVYSLYEVDTGVIRQSGICPGEDCLPEKPAGCEFAYGIEGNPETQRIDFEDVGGQQHPILVPWARPRDHSELVSAIEAERAKRLAAGFDFDFGGERGVHRIGTTEQDERGWDKVTKLASAYLAAAQPDAEIYIVTDTGPLSITAMEWQSVLIAAGVFQQPIYMRSFVLQAMNPIPQDIENEEYWS